MFGLNVFYQRIGNWIWRRSRPVALLCCYCGGQVMSQQTLLWCPKHAACNQIMFLILKIRYFYLSACERRRSINWIVNLPSSYPEPWRALSKDMLKLKRRHCICTTWACERVADYVVGRTFHIEADHNALVQLIGLNGLKRNCLQESKDCECDWCDPITPPLTSPVKTW